MSRLLRLASLALAALLLAPDASAQGCNISGNRFVDLSPQQPVPGGTASISYSFVSVGGGPCPAVEVGHYLSTDQYFSDDDILLGTDMLPASQDQTNLSGGGTVTIPADTPRGGYAILAVADHLDVVAETNEVDNVDFGRFTVGGSASSPDLLVDNTDLDETQAPPGGRVSFDYTVFNAGPTAAQEVEMGYFLAAIGAPPSDWVLLEDENVGDIGGNDSDDEGDEVTIPLNTAPGMYAIEICADYRNRIEEEDETNNCRGAGRITITGGTAGESDPISSALHLVASPNPASALVRLSYALTGQVPVRLVVSDVLGREVLVIEGARGAGVHTETFDTAAWAPGIYLARFAAGEATAALTLTVAR